jgi:hypothetical protein
VAGARTHSGRLAVAVLVELEIGLGDALVDILATRDVVSSVPCTRTLLRAYQGERTSLQAAACKRLAKRVAAGQKQVPHPPARTLLLRADPDRLLTAAELLSATSCCMQAKCCMQSNCCMRCL